MSTNEDLAKNLESLSESVKSKLATLERGATHSGTDPQPSGSGTQNSDADLTGLIPPPSKRTRLEEEYSDSDEEAEDNDAPEGSLVAFSESAAAFLETVFRITIPRGRRLRQKVHRICTGSNVPSWTPLYQRMSQRQQGRLTEHPVASRTSGWMQLTHLFSCWKRQTN